MNASPAQILTLENYKAHLQSVQAELATVSEKLGQTLAKNEEAEEAFVEILGLLSEAQKILDSTERRHTEISSATANKLDLVSTAVSDFKQSMADGLAQMDAKTQAHIDRISRLTVAIAQLEEQHRTTENAVDIADAHLGIIEGQIEDGTRQVSEIEKEISALRNERDSLLSSFAESYASFSRERARCESELEQIKKQVSEEQERVGAAERILGEREAGIKNAEHNIQIIQARLEYIWKDKFPGINPPKL